MTARTRERTTSLQSPPTSRSGTRADAGTAIGTALALLSAQGVTWMTTLVGVLVVPRFLGASGLGAFAAITTATSLVATVAGCGTANHLVKVVARDPDNAGHFVAQAVIGRLVIWTTCFVLGMATAFVAIHDSEARIALIAMFLAVGLGLIGGAATSALQGKQMLGRVSLSAAAIALGSQIVVATVLALGGGLVALAVIAVATSALSTSATLFIFRRNASFGGDWSSTAAVGFMAAGLPFLAWDVALQIYGSVDYLLLAWLTDARTVGEYAFAYRLASIPIFVPTVVMGAVFPILASTARENPVEFRSAVHQSLRVVTISTIPMAAGLMILARELPWLLGGGTEFHDAIPLILVLSIHIPLAAVDTVLGMALFAADRQRSMAVVAWFAAALNPLANLIAIPLTSRYFENGAIGASLTTVATECFMGVWIWTMLKADLGWTSTTVFAAPMAGLFMVASAFSIRPAVGDFGALGVGLAVYVAIAFKSGLITISDARRLRTVVRQRVRATVAAAQ